MKKIDIDHVTEAPVLEPAKQLLWDAADEINRRGLCRGAPYGGDDIKTGPLCSLSAINDVATRTLRGLPYGGRRGVIVAAEGHLCEALGVVSYVQWSDASDQETVVSAMRAAALS